TVRAAVVAVNKWYIPRNHLSNRQRFGCGQMPTVRQPFDNQPVVGQLRFLAAEPPQVAVLAVQGDYGLAGSLVLAITRRTCLRYVRHCNPFLTESGSYRSVLLFGLHYPTRIGSLNLRSARDLSQLPPVGLEPTTR